MNRINILSIISAIGLIFCKIQKICDEEQKGIFKNEDYIKVIQYDCSKLQENPQKINLDVFLDGGITIEISQNKNEFPIDKKILNDIIIKKIVPKIIEKQITEVLKSVLCELNFGNVLINLI